MSRWKASGIHLLLSCAIVGVVLAFMVTVWYRWPLFELAGGSGITLILAGVDVTLGPLITLIVFKSGKKGLKFDLAFIAALQAAALAYGIHVVYVARPVYIAYVVDRFVLVTAKDLDPQDVAKATDPEFRRLPLGRPLYIAAVLPRDPKEQLGILMSALGGKDVQLYPRYYVPYAQQAQNALRHAKDLNMLLERDPRAVRSYLDSAGRSPETVKFLPLRARTDAAVLIDAISGNPLDIVKVDPW
ncbi:MAG TPA: TfpX/TfpZ family type IV pilin accessory protein [Burkholderiales bacterium]|nr:TfpX/TfpZ family type IV pilin accessory protein [Burkholderiales bacterium]